MVVKFADSSVSTLIAPMVLGLTLTGQAMAEESILFGEADPVYGARDCESDGGQAVSLKQEGHYVRHEGWQLKSLENQPTGELEESDATFCIVPVNVDTPATEHAEKYASRRNAVHYSRIFVFN